MATKLSKPVRREMRSGVELTRGKHRGRGIIVSLLPSDEIEFRVKGTRQKFSVYLGFAFKLAQLITIDREYKEKVAIYTEKRKYGRARRPKKPMLPFGKVFFDAMKSS